MQTPSKSGTTAADLSIIGVLMGGGLGALWGVIIFSTFCFYPDNVPCTLGGFAFTIGLFTLPGLIVCGAPLALITPIIGPVLLRIFRNRH
jgi:hypothetical protein